MKTQFIKAANQKEAEYVHDCDPGQRPHAVVTVLSIDETTIECPLCAHKETHQSTQMPARRRKPGGGRIPKYGEATVQLQARVPVQVKAWMKANGGIQPNVDRLVIEPVLAECDRIEASEGV